MEAKINEKLDMILQNQSYLFLLLQKVLKDVNKSQFVEDYVANLAAQVTEIVLGHNIIRK